MKDTLVLDLLDIARDAGRIIEGIYRSPFEVSYKAPDDPVTEADRQANDIICSALERRHPGIAIVAEESPSSVGYDRSSSAIFFVDPLDGTREFVERNGQFVVMIGLVEGPRAVAGVVLSPLSGVAWVGRVGKGAFECSPQGAFQQLSTGLAKELSEASVVVSRSHRTPQADEVLTKLGVREIRPLGSAGLKAAEVARGAADAQVAPTGGGKLWDTCASEALVVASGGCFTDVQGRVVDYRGASVIHTTGIVAAHPYLHEQLLTRLTDAGARAADTAD